MSDLKHYKRLAEIWEANAAFYLKEIERANWLYQELLKKNEELEKQLKEIQAYCKAHGITWTRKVT